MIAVLDALAAWRESVVPTLAVSHALSSSSATDALPSSRLTAKAGTFVVPVCVPIDITETVTVEGSGEEDNADLTAIVTALRALSGQARVASRIHSHVLVSEVPGVDVNKRRQTVLTWKVVASWG
jgi:hypothetical protein